MLTLPPGQYSNHYGGPLKDKLYASQRSADKAPPPAKVASKHLAKTGASANSASDEAMLAAWGMTGSGDAPVEDSIESKPSQLSSGF